ncbi:MAG: hypothetical protein IJC26_00485 [Clostridia bacterium]|nr:hypothetical protein [Clostridia bacterium]
MSAERNVAKNKKTTYNEYRTNAMQWANSVGRLQSDRAIFFDPQRKKYYFIAPSADSDMGYIELASGTKNQMEEIKKDYERKYESILVSGNIDKHIQRIRIEQNNDDWYNDIFGYESKKKSDDRLYLDEIRQKGSFDRARDSSGTRQNTGNIEESDDKGTMKADRSTYMTAREMLLQAMADEELKKSEVYSPLLREYAKRVTELDKKYIQLEVAESEYVASVDAYDDAEKQKSYKNKVDQLTREINRIERDLSAQEESKELKDIVRREKAATRKYTLEEAKRDTSQRMYDYRQSVERKNTREQIDVKVRRLTKKLRENKRKSHIPDDLKQPLQTFLSLIESKSTNSESIGIQLIMERKIFPHYFYKCVA